MNILFTESYQQHNNIQVLTDLQAGYIQKHMVTMKKGWGVLYTPADPSRLK
jgi:hypothetical protein